MSELDFIRRALGKGKRASAIAFSFATFASPLFSSLIRLPSTRVNGMATPTIDQRGPLVAVTDKATQSNYHQIRTTHLDFAINVDWKRQTLSGSITHHLTVLESAHTLILDTAYLEITAARTSAGTPLAFKLAPRNGDMGSALTINLERQHVKGEKVEIVVEFATTDKCTALGWLGAEQTGSGLYPFVYSQNQAIHARSMFREFSTSLCPRKF